MHDSILPQTPSKLGSMILDYKQVDLRSISPSEICEGMEESDAWEPKDPSRLTVEERQFLWSLGLRPEELGYDWAQEDCCRRSSYKEPKKSRDDLLVEEAKALGEQFDYDGSVLTQEQKRALYKKYLDMHLKLIDLQSPQYYKYYEEKSQPLSVSETAWPGTVGYLKADRLKRGYLDPQDLIKRLHKLKPSDNFELRKPCVCHMEFEKSPVYEKGHTIPPPRPNWLFDQCAGLSENRRRLGNRLTDHLQNEANERWDEVTRDIDQWPAPNLHLLRNMGHSPGGTLFPRYLVKGLGTLREKADDVGNKYYKEEYRVAEVRRKEAIDQWKERNPNSRLADDPISIYRTWPADLMEELREIDREAVRRGRIRYIDALRETEKKMQELVAFWRDCGAITGQRSPPLSWWLAPWWERSQGYASFLWPPPLKERLDAIEAEIGYPKREKERLIEISRWKEAIMNTGYGPASPDTPFSQSLLDELDVVWQHNDHFNPEETEDAMIAKIGQWKSSKSEQRTRSRLGLDAVPGDLVQRTSPECPRQQSLVREGVSDLAMVPEKLVQLRRSQSRGRYRARMNSTAADDRTSWRDRLRPRTKANEWTSWRDKLRPRPDVAEASRDTSKPSRKPNSIDKGHNWKVSKKNRQAPTKGCAITPIALKVDTPDISNTQSPPNRDPLRAAKSARSKNSGQQSYIGSSVKSGGIRKTRNKRGQTRGLPRRKARIANTVRDGRL
ncbi:MAG: hypothetical protein Q9217_006745 [Psora testacea]